MLVDWQIPSGCRSKGDDGSTHESRRRWKYCIATSIMISGHATAVQCKQNLVKLYQYSQIEHTGWHTETYVVHVDQTQHRNIPIEHSSNEI